MHQRLYYWSIFFYFFCFFEIKLKADLVTVQLKPSVTVSACEFVNNLMEKEIPLTQDGPATHRSLFEFGYKYTDLIAEKKFFTPIPLVFIKLLEEVLRVLQEVTHLRYNKVNDFTNCILSIYNAGDTLEPHIDVAQKVTSSNHNFYFGEDVIGIVLKPDSMGKFYRV